MSAVQSGAITWTVLREDPYDALVLVGEDAARVRCVDGVWLAKTERDQRTTQHDSQKEAMDEAETRLFIAWLRHHRRAVHMAAAKALGVTDIVDWNPTGFGETPAAYDTYIQARLAEFVCAAAFKAGRSPEEIDRAYSDAIERQQGN